LHYGSLIYAYKDNFAMALQVELLSLTPLYDY
jgi:hypothetical protein